jgi:MFS family permease
VKDIPATSLSLRNRFGLSLHYFCFFAAIGFIAPFMPLYWRKMGFSFGEIGLLVALASAAGAITLIPIGTLSDRLQTRRPFILIGAAIACLCYLAAPAVRSLGAFAVLQTLIGVGGTMCASVTSALAADAFRAGSEGRSFASVRSWGTFGFLAIMGVVYLLPELIANTTFLYLSGLLYIGAGLSTLCVKRARVEGTGRTVNMQGVWKLLSNRYVMPFVASYFLFYMALMPATANLSMYLENLSNPSKAWLIPLAFAVSTTAELPCMLVAGWFTDRFGRRLPLQIAFTVLPLRLALYAFAGIPLAILLQATHGLTFSVIAIVPFAYMNDLTMREYRATGQAILNAAGAAAYALGPLIAGYAADAVGIKALYLVLGVVAGLGSLIFFLFVKEPMKDESFHGST